MIASNLSKLKLAAFKNPSSPEDPFSRCDMLLLTEDTSLNLQTEKRC